MNRHVPVTLVSVFAFARLPTVRVIGVNAGYAFSFVRDAAALRWAAVAEGSQFGLVTCFRKRQLLLWSTRCCS